MLAIRLATSFANVLIAIQALTIGSYHFQTKKKWLTILYILHRNYRLVVAEWQVRNFLT